MEYGWRKEERQRRIKKKEGNEEGISGRKDGERKEGREGQRQQGRKERRQTRKEGWRKEEREEVRNYYTTIL